MSGVTCKRPNRINRELMAPVLRSWLRANSATGVPASKARTRH
jgi:hypothetical protein